MLKIVRTPIRYRRIRDLEQRAAKYEKAFEDERAEYYKEANERAKAEGDAEHYRRLLSNEESRSAFWHAANKQLVDRLAETETQLKDAKREIERIQIRSDESVRAADAEISKDFWKRRAFEAYAEVQRQKEAIVAERAACAEIADAVWKELEAKGTESSKRSALAVAVVARRIRTRGTK